MQRATAARCFRADGSTTLLLTATMLLLVVATTMAGLDFLLSSRQVAAYQLAREIAFRAAETALLDAEAELLAALRAGSAGADARLAAWPSPGQCGRGAQLGLCRPDANVPAPWEDRLAAHRPDEGVGIAVGTFSSATLPDLPAGAGGREHHAALCRGVAARASARRMARRGLRGWRGPAIVISHNGARQG